MSKIGMRPIPVKSVKVVVEDGDRCLTLTNGSKEFKHELPATLLASYVDGSLKIMPRDGKVLMDKKSKMVWGLHRALVAGKIRGLEEGFVSTVRIIGLTYKAAILADKLVFSLGFSHKVELSLDKDISIEIDKTGQLITLKSYDKFKLGSFCSQIRAFRKPEPYKGTGIFVNNEVIIRKAGKSKS